MMRELMRKEAATVRRAVDAFRGWVRPRKAMKAHAFDRPLDDLGQTIDDVERRVEQQEQGPKH
jgi:hypothetical protein